MIRFDETLPTDAVKTLVSIYRNVVVGTRLITSMTDALITFIHDDDKSESKP